MSENGMNGKVNLARWKVALIGFAGVIFGAGSTWGVTQYRLTEVEKMAQENKGATARIDRNLNAMNMNIRLIAERVGVPAEKLERIKQD